VSIAHKSSKDVNKVHFGDLVLSEIRSNKFQLTYPGNNKCDGGQLSS